MLCKNPYQHASGQLYPCSQCMHCRHNRRRLWTNRIVLESYFHEFNLFITLTYDNEHLNTLSLDSAHLRDFIKRMRYYASEKGINLRYFAVGEYGDRTSRPHYHLAVFGLSENDRDCIDRAWTFGFVHVGNLTRKSAQYIAGYVDKKMTKKDDPRLEGRYPEFARMSLRPGIGAWSAEKIAAALHNQYGEVRGMDFGVVPYQFNIGKKSAPLGRYLRRVMRKYLGYGEKSTLQEQEKFASEMRDMQITFKNTKKIKEVVGLKNQYIAANAQKYRNAESRAKLYKQQKTI